MESFQVAEILEQEGYAGQGTRWLRRLVQRPGAFEPLLVKRQIDRIQCGIALLRPRDGAFVQFDPAEIAAFQSLRHGKRIHGEIIVFA